jgi:glycosyltransferase involved in cell wall biosynthesis
MSEPTDRLRVAHIITQLELGGAQRNTLYTVVNLNPKRFEAVLIHGPEGILDGEAKQAGVHSFVVPTLVRQINPVKDIKAFREMYRLLRHYQPDIVHTHSSKAGILGRAAAYFAGVPVIIHTFHGFGFTPGQGRRTRKFFVLLEKICAWMSTHLIFVAEDNRAEAKALGIGPKTPSSLIRSGIEVDQASPAAPWKKTERRSRPSEAIWREMRIPAGSCVVTYVGNFKPQKNPMDLAKVAEKVLAQSPDVYFLLVGDGEKKNEVEDYLTAHGLNKNVKTLGWRRREDIRQILERSSCFLLTSLWEGLPRSLVEAFAARLPAVAYEVNGVRDILKDNENGFPIPPGNVELAAEKVLWLKAHPDEAKQMGERGRRLIERDFDINLMVRQQEALYEKLFEAVPLKESYKYHGSQTA